MSFELEQVKHSLDKEEKIGPEHYRIIKLDRKVKEKYPAAAPPSSAGQPAHGLSGLQ